MTTRSRRFGALLLVVAATVSGTAPSNPPQQITIRIVWDMPVDRPLSPRFDCDNRAYANNNPDKCGLPGPFLLGGGAPSGGGLLGGLLRRLGLGGLL